MIKHLTDKIIIKLLKYKIITEKDIDVYLFGLELLFFKILHIITMLTIGSLIIDFISSLIFIFVYSSIRVYAGGFHAESNSLCLISSIIVMLVFSFIYLIISKWSNSWIIIVLSFFTSLIIYTLAPVDCKNKPLNQYEIKLYKKYTLYLLFIFFTIIIILYFLKSSMMVSIISALICELISLIIGIKKSPIYKRRWFP